MKRTSSFVVVLAVVASCREAPPAAESKPHAETAAPGVATEAHPGPDAGTAAAARSEDAGHVTLLFSASKAGQLVPCGCSPDQRGGLPREVALVKKLRAENPDLIYVDAGDLLFEGAARPNPQVAPQKEFKARTLAKGEELLGAAARVVGLRDLALGPELLAKTAGSVPLLDAGAAPIAAAKASVLVHGVGLFAAGLGEAPEKTIAARAQDLRSRGAKLVVLIAHPRGDSTFNAALGLLGAAKDAGVDFVVLGRRDDPATDLDRKEPGSPPLLAVEGHGQSVLRVEVTLGKGAPVLLKGDEDRKAELDALDARINRFKSQAKANPERAAPILAKVKELEGRRVQLEQAGPEKLPEGTSSMRATFVPLTKEVGEDAEAKDLVASYDEKVTELNLANAQSEPAACPAPSKGDRSFTGVKSCAECHADAVKFWQGTRHAHAYATLEHTKKQFSLDCINCHVTGWQQPGGVCRIDKTAAQGGGIAGMGVGRQDVQCESCHGPGDEHAELATRSSISRTVPVNVCTRCHEPANSPHFDDAKYRPYIIGPGHGAKLAKGEQPHPYATGKGPLEEQHP